jgi:hypothetical protein
MKSDDSLPKYCVAPHQCEYKAQRLAELEALLREARGLIVGSHQPFKREAVLEFCTRIDGILEPQSGQP